MRKMVWILVAVLVLVCAPAFAQWRFDLGVDAVFGLGVLSDSDIETSGFGSSFLTLPMGEAAYVWGLGPVKVGAGVRGISLILVNLLWPDVYAEVDLGPVALEGHIGGLAFLAIGLVNDSATGKVLFPELSAWFRLGKRFRLGAGTISLWAPELAIDATVFVYYLGAKWVIDA
jgi:hypothetical protein